MAVGDVVRVLSRDELLRSVDTFSHGLDLATGQLWLHCDGEFRVSGVVRHFFKSDRMYRLNEPLYMLEGVACSGDVSSFDRHCDRGCALLWSGLWLRHAGSGRSPRKGTEKGTHAHDKETLDGAFCQLMHLERFVANSRVDNAKEGLRRSLRWAKRKARSLISPNRSRVQPAAVNAEAKEIHPMGPGDRVRVRSEEEISNMLDSRGKYRECTFQPEQYGHCGKEYRVLREVDYFYDEVKQKLVRCHDLVVLEGLFCTGRKRLYVERCDLHCYLFWHKDWLNRV